jgi:dihydroxyacetone kinase
MEKQLNELDAKVGDADTGTTFANGAHAILDGLERMPLNDLPQLFQNVGEFLGNVMGGSSGVLLAITFMQASAVLKQGKELGEALMAGIDKMMELGGQRLE